MTTDPKPDSGVDPAGKQGGTGDVSEKITQVVLESLRPEMNRAITGAVGRQLQEAFKSEVFVTALDQTLKKAVADAIPRQPEVKKEGPEPNELVTQVKTLSDRLNDMTSETAKIKEQAYQERLLNGINSVLNSYDGKEGRPKLDAGARNALINLIPTGYSLPGKPALDDSGTVVVNTPEGPKALQDAMPSFLKANAWAVDAFKATGSGASGSNPQAPAGRTIDFTKLGAHEAGKEIAKVAETDLPSAVKLAQQQKEAVLKRMMAG